VAPEDVQSGSSRKGNPRRYFALYPEAAERCLPIYGYIYDAKPGRLIEVPAATEAGKA
jgi:hypothetical protein